MDALVAQDATFRSSSKSEMSHRVLEWLTMSNTCNETTPPNPPSTVFIGLADMAFHVFGSTSRSAKARVVRMADRGELAAIRIGRRGDRLFPVAEISRLHADAADARRETGRNPNPEKQ